MYFLAMDIDNFPLGEDELLFLPYRLSANRYITHYSESYIVSDAGNFVRMLAHLRENEQEALDRRSR